MALMSPRNAARLRRREKIRSLVTLKPWSFTTVSQLVESDDGQFFPGHRLLSLRFWIGTASIALGASAEVAWLAWLVAPSK